MTGTKVPAPPQSKGRPVWTSSEAGRAFSWSRFLMLLALLLMQLLTLLGVLWVSHRSSERALRLQVQTALKQLVRVASDNTSGYLSAASTLVKINQSMLASAQPNSGQLQANLQAVVNAVPQIDGAMVGETSGEFTFVRRDGQERFIRRITMQPRQVTDEYLNAAGQLVRREVSQTAYDPSARPWFKQAVSAAGQPAWTAPYIFASSHLPGITVAATIPNSSPPAVLAMDVQLRGLTRFLQGVQFSRSGRAFIADADGHALAASRAWPTSVQDHIPKLSEVGDPALQALLSAGSLSDVLTAPEVVRQFSVGGQRYGAALKSFEVQPGMTWVIGVYAPESDFTGELSRVYRQQLWIILGVMLLSGIIAWPLAFQATRPLSTLHQQATTDALTGLQNRASFLAHLREELTQAPDPNSEMGVVILDLDGFKAINDTFGHALGDSVLGEIGQRLQESVRSGDILSRLGGDEFALIVKGRSREVVKLRVEGILQDLQRRTVQSGGIEHQLGGTAGLAFRQGQSDNSAEELLARADKALLRGKRRGKGRVWVSGEIGSTLLD